MNGGSDTELLRQIADDVLGGIEDIDQVEVGRERSWPMVVELGWPLVGIPEERGGAGGTIADLATLASSVGRHGAAVPLLEQSLATWILTAAGEDAPRDLVTVACPLEASLSASGEGDRLTVSGELRSVPWAIDAVRVIAAIGEGTSSRVAVVELDQVAIDRRDETNVAGEPRTDLTFDDVPARPLRAGPSVDAIVHRGTLLSTAALVGALEGAYELTRAYVQEREQFGRPLARIHAVSSALAQMSSDVSLARSALDAAVDATDGEGRIAALALGAARVTAVEVVAAVSGHAHQLHGAMGTTREYPLHRVTRRLWSWRDEWGSERSWRRSLGQRVVDAGPDAFWDDVTALCGTDGSA
jgi:acyl-CoA dehydrogenase